MLRGPRGPKLQTKTEDSDEVPNLGIAVISRDPLKTVELLKAVAQRIATDNTHQHAKCLTKMQALVT